MEMGSQIDLSVNNLHPSKNMSVGNLRFSLAFPFRYLPPEISLGSVPERRCRHITDIYTWRGDQVIEANCEGPVHTPNPMFALVALVRRQVKMMFSQSLHSA